jgi:hypothetical protein
MVIAIDGDHTIDVPIQVRSNTSMSNPTPGGGMVS